MSDVTQLLNSIEQGDAHAAEKLLPLVYEQLRTLAAQKMAQEKPGQTLQATALVHEAYLRLVEESDKSWDHRGHFFAAAAEAMRRILVENARRKKSQRGGGGRNRVELDNISLSVQAPSDDILALDEALTALDSLEPDVVSLIKLYYFAGLTLEQAAEVQGISRRTAGKYLTYARAWLNRRMSGSDKA